MTTTETNLLSFLKSTDVYDPDRIASDQELIRRYYLKNGYADFRIVSTDAQFDASTRRLRHHHRGRRGPAVPGRQRQRRIAASRMSTRGAAPAASHVGGLGLQRRSRREVAART